MQQGIKYFICNCKPIKYAFIIHVKVISMSPSTPMLHPSVSSKSFTVIFSYLTSAFNFCPFIKYELFYTGNLSQSSINNIKYAFIIHVKVISMSPATPMLHPSVSSKSFTVIFSYLTSASNFCPFIKYELFYTGNLSQSSINNRNGSSACTSIALLMVKACLQCSFSRNY